MDLTQTLLKGESSPRTWWMYHTSAFRSGKYKIHTATLSPTNPITRKKKPNTTHATPLLFDLKSDMSESNNLAAGLPDKVKALISQWKNVREGY